MKKEMLSPRQLAVAVMVGGLSTAAAAAGRVDWWWLLASVPVGVAIGWLLLRRLGRQPFHPAVRALYGVWAVVLMAQVLRRTAVRLQTAAGGRGNIGWVLALLALFLAWTGWGKAGAFFRAVEIFWLGMAAATAAILLLGLPRVDWRWMLEPAGNWWESALAGMSVLGTGLFALPHIYKIKEEPGGAHRGLMWLGALGLLSAALGLLTAGLLSPGVAAQVDGPFFAAAGLLGNSARLEGLVSALWLLPDLALAGLLARSWGEKQWPALAAAAALALAFTGIAERLPGIAAPIGCLVLAVLAGVFPAGRKK